MTKFSLSYTIAVGLILSAHQAVGQYHLNDGVCYLTEYYDNLPNCLYGYEQIGQKYYWISPQDSPKLNWHGAWHECRRRNGYLASFSDINELYDVANTIYWKGFSVYEYFWTDGNDLAQEGVYSLFLNGDPMSGTLFSPGEPNNPGVERCLHIWTASGQHYYGLNNLKCDEELYYVCIGKVSKVC